jgi:hypothetical protein
MKMRALTIIAILGLLLAALSTEAQAKSFTIRVSCVVPERLELSSLTPTKETVTIEKVKTQPPSTQSTTSKIQTQQIRYRASQKEIIYTILER